MSQLVNVPNLLTFARLFMSVGLFVFIAVENWLACLIIFALAAVTDWFDGYFARLLNQGTAFGRTFDPLVDKVLVCGAFIFLLPIADRSGITAWMATVVVSRELLVTGLRTFMESSGAKFGADWFGKIKMGLQCAALIAIFVVLDYSSWTTGILLRDILIYAMLAATIFSGLEYFWRAFRAIR